MGEREVCHVATMGVTEDYMFIVGGREPRKRRNQAGRCPLACPEKDLEHAIIQWN